jgi:hypothetical protein
MAQNGPWNGGRNPLLNSYKEGSLFLVTWELQSEVQQKQKRREACSVFTAFLRDWG